MTITHHYRNYQIIEVTPTRVLVTLPMRQYPLTGLELQTVEEAMKWVDGYIQDKNDEYKRDMMFEERYDDEGEE